MGAIRTHVVTVLLVAGVLVVGIVILNGCKEKSEPSGAAEVEEAASAGIEQTTCPVMGGAINKSVYTEYKGKKVYFCCAGCDAKFKAEPEKYIAKLPQFKD
jgi:YHS domain-containing protein